MLTARENRRGDLVNFRRREDEHDVGRRLFQSFEQSVERRVGEHVHFIDDVDTILSSERGELDILANFPHVVHARIRRAVDFDDIYRRTLRDFLTIRTGVTRGTGRTLLAVECLRQDPRDRRFSDATRARKEKGVGDSLGGDRIHQRLNDV